MVTRVDTERLTDDALQHGGAVLAKLVRFVAGTAGTGATAISVRDLARTLDVSMRAIVGPGGAIELARTRGMIVVDKSTAPHRYGVHPDYHVAARGARRAR